MFINYRDLPSQFNITLDYMYEFENVERFYKLNFRDSNSYEERFKLITDQPRAHREKTAAAIEKFYEGKNPSPQTLRNLEALRAKNTLAVVTGQQLGLFGGPLYTIYKTITTIKLCRSLKEQYHNFNFVPVFWLEGDDHDFDEIRYTTLFDQSGEIKKIKYDDGLGDEINRGSTDRIEFNENIKFTFNELNNSLRDTEFKSDILKLYESYTAANAGFLSAFSSLMFNLFDDYGLILFSPGSKEIKKIVLPIFENEIMNYREHATEALEVSAELEEAYHAQVKVQPINLFLTEDKGRYLIQPGEGNFTLKGKRRKYERDELLQTMREEPWRFSPNVLLRPICQDYLLPTAFYVGGPSEIAYFAQVIPLYKRFNVVQPYVFPRASATILEKPVQKALDKFGLNLLNLWDEEMAKQMVMRQISAFKLEELFTSAKRSTDEIYKQLMNELQKLDATLAEPAIKSNQRAAQNLDQLYNRAKKAEERVNAEGLRQIQRARKLVFPNDNFQEREINFVYFANKYGKDFLKYLFDELSIIKFEHQLIEI